MNLILTMWIIVIICLITIILVVRHNLKSLDFNKENEIIVFHDSVEAFRADYKSTDELIFIVLNKGIGSNDSYINSTIVGKCLEELKVRRRINMKLTEDFEEEY